VALAFDSTWGFTSNASAATSALGAHSPSASTKLIFGQITTGGGSVTSVTDSQSNAYTVLPAFLTPGGEKVYGFWCVPTTLGSIAITGHYSPNTRSTIMAASFLGTAATSPLDQNPGGANGTGTALTSPTTGTTRFANEILIAYGANDNGSTGNTWTPGSSFNNITNNSTGSTSPPAFLGYRIVSATGTYSATYTNANSAGWAIGIVTFSDTPTTNAYTLNAAAGAYAYNGENANLIWGPTAYTLLAAPGNYDYAGGASAADLTLAAQAAAYAYNGGLAAGGLNANVGVTPYWPFIGRRGRY
jgi:hypothetical protein